jgi:hypothetical protein
MADPDRDPTPPPPPQQPSSSPDDVTQQVPTQQSAPPPAPPTQEIPQPGGYQQQAYGYAPPPYSTPSYEQGGYSGYPGGYQMQPGYGYTAPQTETLAVWGLVVAILAWVACPIPFVPAVVALVLAGNAQRNIDASGGAKEGRGINTATKILAWINIGLWALIAIFVVVAIVASAAANA